MQKRVVLTLFFAVKIAFAAQPLDKVVALVNDRVITASELQKETELLQQQLAARQTPLPNDKELRKQVLQRLIDVDLGLQLAKQNHLQVDDKELDQAIERIATNNHISTDKMREVLQQQGVSWKVYRENIRKDMLIGQLQQRALNKDIKVSDSEIQEFLQANQPQEKQAYLYHLQNILIPLPEEPSSLEVQEAQKKAQSIRSRIRLGEDFAKMPVTISAIEGGDLGERHLLELPEVFAKEVAHMKVGEVVGPLRTGNGLQLIKLVAIKGEKPKHTVTKTHVRHILLKPAASMTPEEAYKQVWNLYRQLASGKDFSRMAKQYSLDIASASKGGDLGWVVPNELVPEVDKAMHALSLHKVSKPIKSKYGWHLLEVLARKTVDDTALFKQQQARQLLQQKKFTEAVANWQQHLRSVAYIKILDKDLA